MRLLLLFGGFRLLPFWAALVYVFEGSRLALNCFRISGIQPWLRPVESLARGRSP